MEARKQGAAEEIRASKAHWQLSPLVIAELQTAIYGSTLAAVGKPDRSGLFASPSATSRLAGQFREGDQQARCINKRD
jgi:hypothetical protein